MNRTLALGLIATVAVWLALFVYDTGRSNTLDQTIATGIVVLYLGVVIHMFVDRRLMIWTASAVGILLGAIGWIALFARFEYGWAVGPLTPGESQGWLDLVRAAVLVGGPMLGYSLIVYRIEKHRTGEPARPGEILNAPTWPEVERRNNPYGRRDTDQPDYKEPTL